MSTTLNRVHFALAAAAVFAAGGAIAQGTPPNANVANPATGAGQQSQVGTPMGTTGVPAANNQGTARTMPEQAMPDASNNRDMSSSRGMRTARADRN